MEDLAPIIVSRDVEAEGRVPGGVPVALPIGRRPLPRAGIAGERHHRVDIHLGEQIDLIEVLGRDQGDLQGPVRHD